MRASLLRFSSSTLWRAVASATVGFNVTWYSTPEFPFVDENYPVTTGIVIVDFNHDGIPDVAYSWPCCENSGSPGRLCSRRLVQRLGCRNSDWWSEKLSPAQLSESGRQNLRDFKRGNSYSAPGNTASRRSRMIDTSDTRRRRSM